MTGLQATSLVINKLVNDSDFVSKLSALGGIPAIISGIVLPSEWDIQTKSVNIYVVHESMQTPYYNIRLSASCRGTTYAESRDIAYALCNVLNRLYDTGLFIVTTVLQTIEPNDADVYNYNTPVEILVRSS